MFGSPPGKDRRDSFQRRNSLTSTDALSQADNKGVILGFIAEEFKF